MSFFKNLDEYSDITDLTYGDRKRYVHFERLSHQLLRGTSDFSIQERELMAAFTSALNGCQYCVGLHEKIAENFGLEEKVVQQLLKDIDQANISEKLKPVLHFIKKLTLTPNRIVQADVNRVLQSGWSEQALSDAIAICSLLNFANRLLDGHGIKGSKNLHHLGAKFVTKLGYKAPPMVSWFKGFIRKFKVRQLNK